MYLEWSPEIQKSFKQIDRISQKIAEFFYIPYYIQNYVFGLDIIILHYNFFAINQCKNYTIL